MAGVAAGAAPVSPAAVASRPTVRPSRSARSSTASAAAMRRGQSTAAAQPSSITSSTGPLPGRPRPASSTGRASPTITSPAATMRSSSSHHGVRAGVSAVAARPSSSRTPGNISRRGAGGVTRSSHHSTAAQPARATPRGRRRSSSAAAAWPACGARAVYSASSAASGGWSVRWVEKPNPAAAQMAASPACCPASRARIGVAHVFNPRNQGLQPLPHPLEPHPPAIRQQSLGRVEHLQQHARRPAPPPGARRRLDILQRAEQVADQHHARMARQLNLRRQPVARRAACAICSASRSSPARPAAARVPAPAGPPARRRAAAGRPAPAPAARPVRACW